MSQSIIEQGSPEWHAMRCGKVTASRVADVIRKTKTGVSASRERYMGELIAERLTGVVQDGFKSADMQWGNDTEDQARTAYSFMRDVDLVPIDFVDHPTIPMSGASPDRLVGSSASGPDVYGLVEIKCPATHTHIGTLISETIPTDYVTQMQWQLACTGRRWCDFVSFDPRMPPNMQLFVRRVLRDADRIAELEAAVIEFQSEIDARLEKLVSKYRAEAA
jgi:putative phage-type endonuclease